MINSFHNYCHNAQILYDLFFVFVDRGGYVMVRGAQKAAADYRGTVSVMFCGRLLLVKIKHKMAGALIMALGYIQEIQMGRKKE